MNVMTYRGYAARLEFDDEDRIFVGQLAGITDIVTFHGESVSELETEFHAAVDHYLEMSERTGIPAQKPFSGEISLKLSPDVHAHAAMMAEIQGKTLNQWAADILANAH
jgi:predicted HicB family RNase H-like nuclease